ncbi:MAG: Riboflavin synthase alpha chain, partial [Thelocarpon superellum]
MFTGIVETIGGKCAVVLDLVEKDESVTGGGGTSLTIAEASDVLGDAHLGDSISINGTCLTITELTAATFKVGVAPETLRRTNLGSLA